MFLPSRVTNIGAASLDADLTKLQIREGDRAGTYRVLLHTRCSSLATPLGQI